MEGDPNQLLQQMQQVNAGQEQPVNISPEEDEMAKYVSVALADNEDVASDF